jgi:hypothetical protein
VADAFPFIALHDNRYAGRFAPFYYIVDAIFEINTAPENNNTVKFMQIGKIIDVHLPAFISHRVYICRVAEKEKKIGFFGSERILHSGKELGQYLAAPAGSENCNLFFHGTFSFAKHMMDMLRK